MRIRPVIFAAAMLLLGVTASRAAPPISPAPPGLPTIQVLGSAPMVVANYDMAGSNRKELMALAQYERNDPIFMAVKETQGSSDWIFVTVLAPQDTTLSIAAGSQIMFMQKGKPAVVGSQILGRRFCRMVSPGEIPGWIGCLPVDVTADGFTGLASDLATPEPSTVRIVLAVQVPRGSVNVRKAVAAWVPKGGTQS